jgi:hypothetical protein
MLARPPYRQHWMIAAGAAALTGPGPAAALKVKFTGLTQNLQVDPEV